MAVIVPAAIAAGIGIYKIVDSANKDKKAKQMAAANQRPVYQIPQGEYDNMNLATARASTGLDDSTRQAWQNNADRGMSSAVSAILRGGGDQNATGAVYDNFLSNINSMTLADNAAKINNIKTLMAQRGRLSDEQDKAWMINMYGPFADKQQEIAQLRGASMAEKDQGIGMVGTAAMTASKSLGDDKTVNNAGLSPATGSTGGSAAGAQRGIGMGDNGNGGNFGNSVNVPGQTPLYSGGYNYGIDLSKLNSNDAAMVNSMLYRN